LSDSPWWHPHIHADRRPFLLARNRVAAGVRQFFAERAVVEVECGALQVSPGNEAHLHAMMTELSRPGDDPQTLYLHTSPEFASKKLLAAGEPAIFSLSKVYRNRERSPLHAPEFTMLEWYRANQTYDAVMRDAIDLLRVAALSVGARELSYRGSWSDPFATPDYLTVGVAYRVHGGVDVLASIRPDGSVKREKLARMAESSGLQFTDGDSWSDIFSRIMSERVEPELGRTRPTVLYEYPAAEAALARVCAHDRRVAERFEVYACGVELANGFGELVDAEEQRRRFMIEMDEKERVYGERYPLDEDFLAALAAMPPASGCAMGFDRLAMLATGASRIDQVIWTPLAP
jgi:elongation factor P--(R)-beta-lysine ligase